MRIPPTGIPFANTLCLKVQMHRNLELNGQTKKIDTENSGDSDDGDDMAKKLTMEIKKFSLMTAQQNQNFQPTNPEYQNSPT